MTVDETAVLTVVLWDENSDKWKVVVKADLTAVQTVGEMDFEKVGLTAAPLVVSMAVCSVSK